MKESLSERFARLIVKAQWSVSTAELIQVNNLLQECAKAFKDMENAKPLQEKEEVKEEKKVTKKKTRARK